jgi:cell division protein FtsQ
MWDRPELLNRMANVMYALAGLAVAYGVLWIVVHMPWFALRHIEVSGASTHVTREQIAAIAGSEMHGTFFTLDLPRVRGAFEKLPWVREVKLRRHWPDRLEVNVTEHVALARWGTGALVNTHGEIFHAAYDGKLPMFIGPPGTSKEVAIQYEFFRRQLAPLGAAPTVVQLTPRKAWQVRLEGGPTIELGREDIEMRLARYVEVHERTVGTLNRRIEYVDLRYADGFAVRIPELKGWDTQPPRGAARSKSKVKRI